MGLLGGVALFLAAGSAGAAAVLWRAAQQARRAATDSAHQVEELQAAVRRACHDMNNPLAAAAINAELLSYSCPDDEKTRQQAEKVQEQIQMAKDAVNALHKLCRPT